MSSDAPAAANCDASQCATGSAVAQGHPVLPLNDSPGAPPALKPVLLALPTAATSAPAADGGEGLEAKGHGRGSLSRGRLEGGGGEGVYSGKGDKKVDEVGVTSQRRLVFGEHSSNSGEGVSRPAAAVVDFTVRDPHEQTFECPEI